MSGHDHQPDDLLQTVRQPFGSGERPRPPFTISPFAFLLGLVGLILAFAVIYIIVSG